MPIYRHENEEVLNRIEKIDITEYLTRFLIFHKKTEWWLPIHPTTLNEATQVKDFLNKPNNTASKSVRDLQGFYYWDDQKIDFIPSNLGEGYGFIYYFICNGCHRKVKYLYEYSKCNTPLCRICCRLSYATLK